MGLAGKSRSKDIHLAIPGSTIEGSDVIPDWCIMEESIPDSLLEDLLAELIPFDIADSLELDPCELEAKGESRLLYYLKNWLNANGWDLIKKRMWRDGHLMDDMQQYLRSRKGGAVMIYNNRWAIEGIERPWNDGELVRLELVRD